MSDTIAIEVACVAPEGAFLVPLSLPSGSTVADAWQASGLAQRIAGVVASDDNVGIFSRRCTLATALRDGDRVEIYRPLLADPKDLRRQRAARQKKP
jgi:uncharacterized protein